MDRGNDALFPVTRYLAMASVLMVTVWCSANLLPRNAGYPVALPVRFLGDFLVEGWIRWDGGWYAGIAEKGYGYTPGVMSSVAFFPAYPLAMRLVHVVVRDPAYVLPGIVLTVAAGLGAIVVIHRWCRRVLSLRSKVEAEAEAEVVTEAEVVAVAESGAGAGAGAAAGAGDDRSRAVARTTVVLLLLFPYAWYLYGAVYADALFLLAAFGAFVLLERDQPLLAGLVAVVATAARPVGLGLVLGLVAVMLERRGVVSIPFLDRVGAVGWRSAWRDTTARARLRVGVAPSRLRWRDGGVVLALGGLGAWMWYLGSTFGDPLLFVHIEGVPGWDQGQGSRTWLKISWLGNVRRLPQYALHLDVDWDKFIYTLGTTFQALLVMGALCLVPAVVRRLGWGYAAYVLGVVGIPLLGSKDWQGTGRYLLAAVPVFVVVAGWLVERSPRIRWSVLVPSGLVLVFLTSAFARGFYLA